MEITPDFMFERDKLKKQVKKWQWLFLLLLVLFFFNLTDKNKKLSINTEEIARIRLEGELFQDPELVKTLKELENNEKVKALIVSIDSPGGVSYAGEELYVKLKEFAKKKPVVAVLESIAASGGYMVALGADHIVARNMTITGSIGVIWQSFEAVELANKLGVKFVNIKSSPLKAAPNPMEATTDEALKAADEVVQDSYQIFLQMVVESRHMEEKEAKALSDGRIFTGRKAKDLNLIDEIGGENEAIMWLEKEKNISSKIKVIDVEWGYQDNFLHEAGKFLNLTNALLQKAKAAGILNIVQ